MSQPFMNQDFLLQSQTAKALYHQHAANMPIIDYHCHIDPKEIYEDRRFSDLSELWLESDHYKWRAMRSCGVAEQYITGDATPYERFEHWANCLPRLIGNPLYHWTHLELQRYFDIHLPLSPKTCRQIWDEANNKLQTMTARGIVRASGVEVICTTDDPADDLHYHRLLLQEENLGFQVLPAFRPDRALDPAKPDYRNYLATLSTASGITIADYQQLKTTLVARLDAFHSLGARAADHGLPYISYEEKPSAEEVFAKALAGQPVSQGEADAFRSQLLVFLSGEYRKRNMVMQLHFGVVRNVNPVAFAKLGPDTGFDTIWGRDQTGLALGHLLGRMEQAGGLPRTILYSLNPTDNAQIGAAIGAFQSQEHPGKIQHGSAWWFNDTKTGMVEQITSLANFSALGHFIGMLTDSRSFVSYTRHEYFRRILCNLIGTWVEQGEYPSDQETLGQLVEDICYRNAKRYFGL